MAPVVGPPEPATKFYRIEVAENDGDGDGVADWSEWRRGTDPETLAEVNASFSLAASELP